MTVLFLILTAAMLLGVAAALAAVKVIDRRARSTSDLRQPPGLERVRASLHAGTEQVLIALARELQLPRDAVGAEYGALYLDVSDSDRLQLRSHSMIGRGLLATIELQRSPNRTELTYAIARLPGDETLNARVLELEMRLISALRRIDPRATIRVSDIAMRDLNASQDRRAA